MAFEQDAEAGDEIYYKFVRRSQFPSGFEDEIPCMKNRFYLLECAAMGPGGALWLHFGRTVDEAIEKCLQQTVACVLAAINLTANELELQLKAGHLENLPELPKDFFTEKRVEDALRARARRPTDVPRDRSIREERDRLNSATRAAAGVIYVKKPGGGVQLVVRKDGARFSMDRHDEAVEYALELSPTLRKREEDRGRKMRLLERLRPSGSGGGVATATTSPDASPRPAPSPEASPRPAPSPEASPLPAPSPGASQLSATSPDASPLPEATTSSWELTSSSIQREEKKFAQLGIKQLISTGNTLLAYLHVGHDPNTEKPDPTAVQIFQDSLDAVRASDETEEESDDFLMVKALAEFERSASLKPSPDQDSFKLEVLRKQFPFVGDDVLEDLAKVMGFTCCLRHDLAVVEGIILAPKALGVYTFYYPGYWTKEPERREHHHWIHNLAQFIADTAVQRRTLLDEGQLFFDKCAVAEDEASVESDRDSALGVAAPQEDYAGHRKRLSMDHKPSDSDESST